MDRILKGINPALARKNHVEILQTLQAYLAAVNEAAIVSITDLSGKIIYVNQLFTEISKYPAEELIGKNHRLINSGYHKKDFFKEMWQTINAGKHWRGEIKNKAKDGSYYWVDTVITPMFDQNGKIFQFLSVRNLINAQKENEERLISVQQEIIKREKQLNDAQRVAKTGSWYLNVNGKNQLEWSEETYHIFEIPAGTEMNYDTFIKTVHADDREMVNARWQEALKTGTYHVEHRITTKSGEKWVSERARFEFDKTSDLKSALGTVQDITEKKKIEDALRESEELYKTLFNNSPFAVGIMDKKTMRFLEVNETATILYGYSKEEFVQLSVYDIRLDEDHEKLKAQISHDHYAADTTLRRHKKKNGDIILIEPSITSISFKGRDVYLITIHDITEKLKIQEELNQAKLLRQKDILETEERSRSAIGMELHDNVNQLLAAARLYIQNIKTDSVKNKDFMQTALNILSNAHEEIRKLSASLVTPALSQSNLKDSVIGLSKSYELLTANIQLNISIDEAGIPEGLKTNIYRIIQEQFSNIIKHAEATNVSISLTQQTDEVVLEIDDNGKGFNVNQAKKGIGLTNITFRAEAWKGKVYIDTGMNKGCKVKIRFDKTAMF